MADQKVAVVVGVGPGLGIALARRFARGGYAVGLMARSQGTIRGAQEEIEKEGGKALAIACDAGEPSSVAAAFAQVKETLGSPEVLIYNAGLFMMGGILELTPEKFMDCWKVYCFGGFLSAQQVLPDMVKRGRGTILMSGATAALRGSAKWSTVAVGKFGLRSLSQSIAREFGAQGIHCAHVVIDGQIDTPMVRKMMPQRETHTFLSPTALAEVYWQLHMQDSTVWTQEIDVRPSVEKF
jgi:NAD(P)-dependent dehydrogenase (short-subunit alcohol dehydrogenase family)